MINKSELIWITTSDIKKARSFFEDTLGMRVMASDDNYGWLELQGNQGGCTLGVGNDSGYSPIKPGSNAVVTLSVDNIEQSKAALEAKGVRFIGEILEIPEHVKMALFVDFDNNHFQLVQKLN